VITKDVPPGALGVARERQRNVEDYAARRKEREEAAASEKSPAAAENSAASDQKSATGERQATDKHLNESG
jgi:bifunctional UDP-N-acetylglucosamine pyrophosphorylase/glucosamine-1-phosphate N-acetyltransferase